MNLPTFIKRYNFAMHSARVMRAEAEKDASTRTFWLRSALEEYHRARIIRARIRLDLKHPVRNDLERMSVRGGA